MPNVSTKQLFVALFIFFVTAFTARFVIVGQAIYGDGISYYAYARSIVKDFDIQFANEYEHVYSPSSNNTNYEPQKGTFISNTKTSYASNFYPIGPGLLWIPSFMVADIFSNIANIFNPIFPNNGYSNIYQFAVAINNIAFVIIGLWITFNILKKYFSRPVSILTILATGLGTNLFYYGALDVINSHSSSFLVCSIFFYILLLYKRGNKYIILGILSGLLALIRTQDIIFIFFVFIFILFSEKSKLFKKIMLGILTALPLVVIFSVQLISWKIIYGDFLALPYITNESGFNYLKPRLIEVLFNLRTGLLVWTPFFIFAIIGFLRLGKTVPKILYIFLIIQLYIISTWSGWSQGESFSIRMLISLLPIFALGFGKFISGFKFKTALTIVLVLIIFNFAAIIYFLGFVQGNTFDMDEVTQDRSIKKVRELFQLN